MKIFWGVGTNFRIFVNHEAVAELAPFIGSSSIMGVGSGDLLRACNFVGHVASSAFSSVNYTKHKQRLKTQIHHPLNLWQSY
ncbi:hypothetical protein Ahy_A07g034856 isoform B [Arachis hypogaea]|uniref:Uncharacterized protein n=1 Tax=Arachis hypogaea TaxID=3818 RepID=A0A445CD78_ARAHY|nr:hypothetical protein Ahy_A07g034856 isoform B [Arachis hypogaea]